MLSRLGWSGVRRRLRWLDAEQERAQLLRDLQGVAGDRLLHAAYPAVPAREIVIRTEHGR